MAKIVTITNPLTGQPAQVDQLDHTAQQIDDGLNIARGVSNPNLLDNWYFADPVNQRGQTSYTGTGYGIDRWKSDFGNAVLIESDEYLTVGSHQFHQLIENYKSFVGKTVTCSVLSIDASVDMYIQTGIGQKITQQRLLDSVGKYVSITTFVMPENATKLDFLIGGATTKKIVACKLELGSQQTLAHQENGVWQLNEIPDYGEQLARCNMYQVLYGNLKSDEAFAPLGAGYLYNGNTIFVMLDLPQELCKSATKEVEIIGSLANFGLYYNQSEYVVPSAVSIDQVGTRYIGLKFTVTSTPASSYVLKPRTTGTGLLVKANL